MGGNSPFGGKERMPSFQFSRPQNDPMVDKWTNFDVPDMGEEAELTSAQRTKLEKNYSQLKKLLAKDEKQEKKDLKQAEKDYAKAKKQCTKAKTEEQKSYCADLGTQVATYKESIIETHAETQDELQTSMDEIQEILNPDDSEEAGIILH